MSPLLRLALPALAIASTAFAAADCEKDYTIKTSGDASSFGCSSFKGTLTIDSKTADDISIGGLEELDGDLILEGNSAIKRLGASSLANVTGELRISNVENLVGLDFPKLTKADKIMLAGLPNLRQLGFDAVISNASSLTVQNTKLGNLVGIDPMVAKTVTIAGNDDISEIRMQTTNVTDLLEISHNNQDLQVFLPSLKSANNATFRACASIDLSSLQQINKGSLGIYESKKLESFAAPNLTRIDGALTIANNDNLGNVSFSKLEEVTDNLQIANNTNLNDLSQFPQLSKVRGALDLSGNITKIDTPKLSLVEGVFNLQSTSDIKQTCTDFYDPLNQKKKLGPQNKYVCKGDLNEAKTAGTTSGSGSKPSGNFASPLNAQNTYLGLAGLFAVLFV